MPVTDVWKLDKVTAGTPALDVSHIQTNRIAPESVTQAFRPAGHVQPMHTSLQEQKPVIEATTPELAAVLGAVSVGGAALVDGDAYLKKATKTGNETRASLAHQRIRITDGIIYWTRALLPHNGQGTVDFVMVANYDGANLPFLYAGSLALPGNLVGGDHFGAGPAAVNGVAINGIQEIEINSGIQVLSEGAESELWPTFVGIELTEPTVRLRTRSSINLSTYPLTGTPLNGTTGLTFYARKFAADNGRVADNVAEHIQFLIPFGMAVPEDISGDGTQPTADTLTIAGRANTDESQELVVNTASMIT